jgi:multiple sugar transport system ATP-binding protein
VALARAIVRDPDVFLLDEPLSNLDAKLRALARDELKSFQRQIGKTTIYVTHDQIEAMGMGDRVAVLYNGKLQQIGTPQELYGSPNNTFVATFLGSPPMNILEQNNELIGFRPEQFLPKAVHVLKHGLFELMFRVTRIEYLGADRYLYGEVDSIAGEVKVVSRLPSLVTTTVEVGGNYEFAVQRDHVAHFDKVSGLRTDSEKT